MEILRQNLMILASAGSGKTYQLGNRIIGLVAGGAKPEEIIALTFTRKAAGEFADAVLSKLAKAATDPATATRLRQELNLPEADFTATLERVVRSLPRLTLGTIDSFFAKVVRLFQYEFGITGGTFELVEGPRAAALVDEIIADVLDDALTGDQGTEFLEAFRRSTIGREDQGVLKPLRESIRRWQARLEENRHLEWGPRHLAAIPPEEWELRKSALTTSVLAHIDSINFTDPRQHARLVEAVERIEQHTIGSGSLGSDIPTLLKNLFEAVALQPGTSLTVKSQKDFTITGPCADALRRMIQLAADCETSAALIRTRAVRQVVGAFDTLCESRLRRQGRLGFHDVKVLMGEWSRNEESRLKREAIDFRLDARIRHWLLDEFQDTSRPDWLGLQPLIDEAASSDDGTLFVVGDRKQAIYAWRGGEVGLFDELIDRYPGRIHSEPMAESWRSCPEVLELVNHVCGDTTTLRALFGPISDNWQWDTHVTAPPIHLPDRRGEARVEVLEDRDARLARLTEILKELGIGERKLTCGVLLRSNDRVREVAEHLRSADFDVIEEGRREPSKDNPLGIATTRLLRWLANPADRFSKQTLAMSPLGELLTSRHGDWPDAWSTLTRAIAETGFASTIGGLISDLWPILSDFGRRRAGDLLEALTEMDRLGLTSIHEAADWLDRLEIAQSPGSAAVQVMTIHKSKGLGFDVVVLPEVPDDSVPQAQYFDVAEDETWISETPPKWARQLIPPLRDAEERWGQTQRYEALCTLYVALTRAKRGLYVLIDPAKKNTDPDKPSLTNWLRQSTGAGATTGVAWQSGDPSWVDAVEPLQPKAIPPGTSHTPGPAVPRRRRHTPSQAKSDASIRHSATGMAFGTAVHELFESIVWIDETPPTLPDSPPGEALRRVLAEPSLADLFARDGRSITLLREQAIDAMIDGSLTSGVIDRLHIHRDPDGRPTRLHVIDYKTDAVEDPAELLERYRGQMIAYREALRRVYPTTPIDCTLLSVRHARRVDLADHESADP